MASNRTNPTEWVDLYGDALYRYAMARLHDESLAEDLVQETLLAGMKVRDRFAGNSSEKTWLIGILKHKIVDHFRKSSRETVQDVDDAMISRAADSCFDKQGRWRIDAGPLVQAGQSAGAGSILGGVGGMRRASATAFESAVCAARDRRLAKR